MKIPSIQRCRPGQRMAGALALLALGACSALSPAGRLRQPSIRWTCQRP